ncbi:MAG TPA: hypothetical protein VGM91_02160 [Conexibacter sp.]|jgi:hypothetical protein
MSAGLLFSQMQPPAGWEDDFHDWYEREHIPVRVAIPGFESAVRYELSGTEGGPTPARFLACYFIDDTAALETPEYKRLKSDPSERTARMLANVEGFTRYICDQVSDTGAVEELPSALLAIAFNVPDSDVDEFEGWYEEEHVPLLMQVPGWLRVRRYRVRPGFDGAPWTHLALHEVRDVEALSRPERAAARDTPRRDALASRDWFASGRWVYRPIHRAAATHVSHASHAD